MLFRALRSWLDPLLSLSLSSARRRRPIRARRTRRPDRLLFELLEDRLAPAAFAVNSTADTVAVDLATGLDAAGNITLRSALQAANSEAFHAGDNSIVLPAGMFTLSLTGEDDAAASGDLDVAHPSGKITITGAGANATIVDAAGIDRVFHLLANTSVDLAGLTIRGGSATEGGGISIVGSANVTLSECILTANAASSAGGIRNQGTLLIAGSVLSGNGAGGSAGGIRNSGALTLTGSTLAGNIAAGSNGGGIENLGTMTISASAFAGNSAGNEGGGIHNAGTATISGSTVTGNSAHAGGGIFNLTTMTVISSSLTGNAASFGGGGFFNAGTATVQSSAFAANSVDGSGGGIHNNGALTVNNSTLSGNAATSGGGVNNDGDLTVSGATIAGNSATTAGGGIRTTAGTLTLRNTILGDNVSPSGPDVSGAATSNGNNLIENTAGSSGFSAGGDLLDIDARLAPLADNGGPTLTHALLAGSPALDAGNNTGATPFDQRGFLRIKDGPDANTTSTIDMGAFEAQIWLADSADQAINEDAALAFNFATSLGIANVTAASGNTALVSNGNISVTGIGGTRALSITPTGNQSGTALITITVSDGTSSMTDTFVLTVNAVNDAPVLDNTGAMTLQAINEDDVSSFGTRVADVILSAAGDRITDVDTGAVEGIAVIGVDNTNGAWQFSTDSAATWSSMGAPTDAEARLLAAGAFVRFVPNADFNGGSSITFRAWDQTAGVNGAVANATTNGGSTAFSAATETAAITVHPISDAPVLDNAGAMTLPAINEDDTNSGGATVANLIQRAGGDRITDADAGAVEGIAVISVDNASGAWQFSTDGGANWANFGAPSGTSARLLAAGARVRFVPTANFHGTVAGGLTFRAWDQTTGTNGGSADVSTNGGTTAFSTATETAAITVNPVNDAPVLDNTGIMTLAAINEDATNSGGTQVADLILSAGGDRITDVDVAAVEGIAVRGVDNSNGAWQFSIDGAATWNNFGAVSDAQARLLTATALVRFVPNADYNGGSSFSFRAWDQTSGANGGLADASTNGGITAFSVATETAAITVNPVNDAPVLDNTGAMTLPAIDEDQANIIGSRVSDVILSAGGNRITDVDAGAVEGIAVTAADNANGAWQFSTDGGATGTDFGAPSPAAARLLTADAFVRFVPNANFNGVVAAGLTFRAWDQTAGTNGGSADVSTNGGTTAFSTASETVAITVNAVNDAPVLDNSGVMTLPAINEDDTNSAGSTVANLIQSAGGDRIVDVDVGAVEGIAVTGVDNAGGAWQFSTDNGVTWTDLNAPSATQARLLAPDAFVRFVSNVHFHGGSSLTFRAWDQTSGSNGGIADASTNGGITAFSAATETASITVNPVNDAPVLDNSGVMTLPAINEDDANSAGSTVANLILSAGGDRITDVDVGAVEGIAVTSADNANGAWQYSTDGGATWTAFGAPSAAAARLLAATAVVRFVPSAHFHGTVAGGLTFRAWDQSTGANGDTANTSTSGGASAFSTALESAAIIVNSVNDAPLLDNSGVMMLPAVNEDSAPGAGMRINDLILSAGGDRITDVDDGAVEGVAVIGVNNTSGVWQYSTDNGVSWIGFGTPSAASARLLAPTAFVRFVPNADFDGSSSFTFRAWDQTSGANGVTADASATGGSTAFSAAAETAAITVNAVNDAPVLDNTGAMSLPAIDEDDSNSAGAPVADLIQSAGGDRITDVDAGAVEGIAVTGVVNTNGDWQYSINNGTTWISFGAPSAAQARLLVAGAFIRFVPAANFNGAVADGLTFRAWDQTSGANGGTANIATSGGSTAFSSAVETAAIVVNPVNDAPVLDNTGAMTLPAINEDDTNSAGASVENLILSAGGDRITDVDASALEGIAVIGVDNANGAWQFSTDGGANWTDFGAPSAAAARLLTASAFVHFVPAANFHGGSSFSFRAWDRTTGVSGSAADASINGGITAFSAATESAAVTVNPVNDAPVLDNSGAMTLPAINEDDANSAGAPITALLESAGGDRVTDVDDGAVEGIAVIGVDNANGTWQFSTNGGADWTNLNAPSPASVRLLAAGAFIRFVPAANFHGTVAAGITFHAWDQTSGTNGGTADASTAGGNTAFSAETETVAITVQAVNDAPVLDSTGAMSLPALNEDDTNNAGTSVASLIQSAGGNRITDVDVGAVEGIAVTAVDNTSGTWQFSTNGGTTWTDFGLPSLASARLLAAGDFVRFVPAANFHGTVAAGITFRAWDQTSGAAGDAVDASTNGGVTAFSAATESAAVTVNSVNDAPLLDNTGSMTLPAVNEDDANSAGTRIADVILSAAGDRITDLDAGAVEGIAVFGVDSSGGAWQFSIDSAATWTSFGAPSTTQARLLAAGAFLRFVPNADFNGGSTLSFRAWDQTSGVNGGTADASTAGGSTAFSAAAETAAITVHAVNDGPASVLPAVQKTRLNKVLVLSGLRRISIADIDAGAGIVRVTIAATNGTLRVSNTAGLSGLFGNGKAKVTLIGTVAAVNAALDGLRFKPKTDFRGKARLTIVTDDLGNLGLGGAKSHTGLLTINVK